MGWPVFAELEEAAVAFARHAPGQLVGQTIGSLAEALLEVVVGRRRSPTASDAQPEVPWSCTLLPLLARNYRHTGWPSNPTAAQQPNVRFRLVT